MIQERKKTRFCSRSIKDLTDRELIGKGAFATVFKCTDRSANNQIVAVKKVKLETQNEGFPSASIREISILRQVKHKNVVRLIDVVLEDNYLYLIFQYLEKDLKEYINFLDHAMDPSQIKLFMHSILSGVAECHSKRILHRDLKTANILINSDGNLKIADFGLARKYQIPSRPYSQEVATMWYRAPEILLGLSEYSTSIDMWSVGCIFAEMVTRRVFFEGISEIDQLYRIFKILGTPNQQVWPGVSRLKNYKPNFPMWTQNQIEKILKDYNLDADGIDLLKKLLTYDQKIRISAEEALSHPYFNDIRIE